MAGRVIDLSTTWQLPDFGAFDTCVLIDAFMAPVGSDPQRIRRARNAVASVTSGDFGGFILPPVLEELLHFYIRTRYEQDQPNLEPTIRKWTKVYKRHPLETRKYAREFETIILPNLRSAGFVIEETHAPSAGSRSIVDELCGSVRDFALLTKDALIVSAARNLGCDGVVTADQDMMRAQSQIDIYTWR